MFTYVNIGGRVMKRIARIFGIILLTLAAVAGVLALYVEVAGIPRYAVERIELHVEQTPERVRRGRKLTTMLCAGCHLDRQSGRLGGHEMVDVPKRFGTVYS